MWLHTAPILKEKNGIFWSLFSVRVVEILMKCYWDVWEDGALFHGGTGAKEFRNSPNKW